MTLLTNFDKELCRGGYPSCFYPGRRYFVDPEEYLEVLTPFYRDPDKVLGHEIAHLKTAWAVGMDGARLAIDTGSRATRIQPLLDTGIFFEVPRLAVAAVCVAPDVLSSSDVNTLRAYGYGCTIEQVGEKIMAWNAREELQIPLPLSFKP